MQSGVPPVRVVSVLPVLGHPRDSKRVSMLRQAGFDVSVAAFERAYHQGRMPDAPVTSLGRIEHGRYLRRAIRMIFALPKLRRALRGAHLAYASGQDMALFAIAASLGMGLPVVLEVGDIRHVQVARGFKGRIARMLDRLIVGRSRLLVVTAKGFAEGHYRDRLGSRIPWLLMENKLDEAPLKAALSTPRSAAPPRREGVVRIGYFGVIRCPWSWQALREVARRGNGRFEVVIAGFCMDPEDLPQQAGLEPRVSFHGSYRSPQDLPGLYESVDMVWACYPGPDREDPDWRWAQAICRSNRFYESCFFGKPLITLAESADGQEVERLGIGLALREQSIEAVWSTLDRVTEQELGVWRDRMARLPRSVGVYTDEPDRLRSALLTLVRSE